MPNRLDSLHQIARRVENLDRARQFYRDTVGLTELFHFPGLAFFALGPTRLMLRETGKREDADILYFQAGDIEARFARITQAAKPMGAPHRIHTHPDGTEEWMAFFEDDEGRPLALAEVKAPTAPPP